jgi:sigma-E factor negative regulatory protein RseC
MIEERARVVAVEGHLAEVETQRTTACGACSAKGGCGSALLASLFGSRPSRIRVLNRIQAQAGERVIIGLQEAAFLKAAFALYAAPLLAMIAGAVAGEWLAAGSLSGGAELPSLAGGLLGLAAGLVWARRFSARSGGDASYQAVVLRRDTGADLAVQPPEITSGR